MSTVEPDILRAAKRLVNDPAMEMCLGQLAQDAYQEFATSAPGDKEVRDQAYNKQLSLVQITAQIKKWSDMAG